MFIADQRAMTTRPHNVLPMELWIALCSRHVGELPSCLPLMRDQAVRVFIPEGHRSWPR